MNVQFSCEFWIVQLPVLFAMQNGIKLGSILQLRDVSVFLGSSYD